VARLAAALAAVATSALAAPAPAAAEVLGIDVSRFDGRIAWQRVADAGIEFAFVEASRGSGEDCTVRPRRCGADPLFARNYRAARSAGLRVGAYHRAFAGGRSVRGARRNARVEAKLFVEQVGTLRRGDLLPALDVETPFGGLAPRALRAWIRTWLESVRARLGARPLIYTNLYSWQFTGDVRSFARAGHRLWVANWGVRRPAVPAGNWDGRGWSVWQFTNDGRVPGVPGRPDMNRLGAPFRAISVR
jgi:lysozyme